MPASRLAGASTSIIQPLAAGSPVSAVPKQASRAAVSHAGGSAGRGMKANAHQPSSDVSQSPRTTAGSLGARMAYPTFQRNESIFQFAE